MTVTQPDLLGPVVPLPEVDLGQTRNPIAGLLRRRLLTGILSVVAVAVIVFFATEILPGDAATAILGNQATPARAAQLRHQLGLDHSVVSAFWSWSTGILRGNFGTSLTESRPVWQVVGPRLTNSAVLVAVSAVLSSVIGVALGALAAARRDRPDDHVMSVLALVAAALPEFVIGVFVVLVLSLKIVTGLPALSLLDPGHNILSAPSKLVLPVITLVIVTAPYVFRMTRAASIEALTSDYAELALLKGSSARRMLFRHALPNAVAPIVQVIGLNLLYLAGGIVVVETVFQYPGIGLTLVGAVNDRDVPVIQFIVLLLAVFYVVLNIVTDLAVLVATPRRRYPR